MVPDRARRLGERARVEIEHGLGIRLIAGGRIVAAQQQEVPHPERGGAHQLALERNAVTVAAGQLEDRLDPGTDQQRRRRQGAHMGAGAGPIGDVDGIRQAAQRQRLCGEVIGIARHRRRHLGGDDESAGREALRQILRQVFARRGQRLR
jgi:hypothetical protein